jgi:peptide/nickel transport system permease protein
MSGRFGEPVSMGRVVPRVLRAGPLLLFVSALVFLLIHAAPGGPTAVFLANPGVRPQDIERLRRALGLDQPLLVQYVRWLAAFAVGDWGFSFSDNRPVLDRIVERVPATLELASASLLLAWLLAVPAAMGAAIRRGRWFDRIVLGTSAAAVALPAFWFGLVLQLVFANALGWLPSSGRVSPGDGGVIDRLQHLILPATVLAGFHAAAWSRYLRASVLDVLEQPHVHAAHARGVPRPQVLRDHVLRNALLPTMTAVLLDAALLVSGAVVTESVFAWPGLGSLFTEALARRDYTVLMAMLMIACTAVVVVNIAADLAYAWLDPRVAD